MFYFHIYILLSSLTPRLSSGAKVRCWCCSISFFFFRRSGTVSYHNISFFFLLFPFPGLELGTLRGRCPSMTLWGNGRERGDKKKGVHADGVRKRSREPGGRELAAVGDWKRRDRAGSALYSFLSLDLLDVLGCYCSRVIWVRWGFSIWCPNIIVVDQEDRGELDLGFGFSDSLLPKGRGAGGAQVIGWRKRNDAQDRGHELSLLCEHLIIGEIICSGEEEIIGSQHFCR